MDETDPKYGGCYSNGIYGNKWVVYQITCEHADGRVTFKIVAGAGCRVPQKRYFAARRICALGAI